MPEANPEDLEMWRFPTLTKFVRSGEDLPAVKEPVEAHSITRSFDGEIGFTKLIELRSRHETRYAKVGIRTQARNPDEDVDSSGQRQSIRRKLLQEYTAVLKNCEDAKRQSGLGRQIRWGYGVLASSSNPKPSAGNARNAAATARERAGKVRLLAVNEMAVINY